MHSDDREDIVSVTLHIDWTKCDGRGLCTELLPEVLDRDDWGYPLVRKSLTADRSNAAISPDEVAAARDAVKLCPKLALGLRD